MLLAAPLCVVVVAASVAFAATPDTQHSSDTLDKLHEVRPDAASNQSSVTASASAMQAQNQVLDEVARGAEVAFAVLVDLRIASDQEFAAAIDQAVTAFEASLVPPAPARTWSGASGGASSAAPAVSSAGSGGALACIRAHESDSAGGYQAVSSGGTYRGAYQFLQGTWNSTAEASGRPDLVGVDPASASPADQDAMASSLYSAAGSQPWGGRC